MRSVFVYALTLAILLFCCGCTVAEPVITGAPTAGITEYTQPIIMETPIETTVPTVETEVPTVIMQQRPATSVSVPMTTYSYAAEDGTVLFNYSYQSISLIVQEPEVADRVIVDFLNRVDSTAAIAEQLQKNAEANYTHNGWIPYLCRLLYEPARIDQNVLSLFGAFSTYSGGMHPDHMNISANYDLVTGDVLTLGSIMHKDATTEDFSDLVLEVLKDNAKKLYLFDDYANAVEKRFQTDESQDENFYFTNTGLCFYFSPYEIAPYSSGTIIAEIPYEKLLGVLHDSYFPAERDFAEGTITVIPFEKADFNKIHQISEATLTRGSEMYLLTTDKPLQNVRICYMSDDQQIQEYIFFATSELNINDGIMIEATDDELQKIIINYETSGGIKSFSPFS